MKRLRGGVGVRRFVTLDGLAAELGAAPFLAIGTFDGVHRGHRSVIRTMVAAAHQEGAPAAALTFRPHPVAVLRPEAAPLLLSTYERRAELLGSLGIDALVELPFTPELAAVPAASFVQDFLCGHGGARAVFVGADFTFGAGAEGSAASLAAHGRQHGLRVRVVPLRRYRGAPIGSTRIREALRLGRVGEASAMLGQPFALSGTVQAGEQRGRALRFPTANLVPDPTLVQPATGVYAVGARRVGIPGAWPAVANLGSRPTVDGRSILLEVHLLDFGGDLYGQVLEVAFIRRLRAERRFPNLEALRAQIARDVARARQVLGAQRPATGPADPLTSRPSGLLP